MLVVMYKIHTTAVEKISSSTSTRPPLDNDPQFIMVSGFILMVYVLTIKLFHF